MFMCGMQWTTTDMGL
jgi:hypothetical protein